MQAGYFRTAWRDISTSPGWFNKILLLALIACVPVFGQIVVAGYLLGWARERAWGVDSPLPAHILGNEDGKLYVCGFFALVINVVFALLPAALLCVGNAAVGVSVMVSVAGRHGGVPTDPLFIVSAVLFMAVLLATVAAVVLAVLFSWVGYMRMSIYGRLSAGFQFGHTWAMIRKDPRGILRIFGMRCLFGAAIVLLSVVFSLVMMTGLFVVIASLAVGGGDAAPAALVSLLAIIMAFLIALYGAACLTVFSQAMVARALGYWTQQFDVPLWRGQDDPLPFQMAGPSQ